MSRARFGTLTLHTGAAPDPAAGACTTPIHPSTPFVFRDSERTASLFDMERADHMYSCISNPTVVIFEGHTVMLENGVGAIATVSDQAVLHLVTVMLMGVGSHIVAFSALCGGSHNLLHYTLRRFGIETIFVKSGDINGRCSAIHPNTRPLFGETLDNPGLDALDIPTVVSTAHDAGASLLVDSVFTTPWLLQSFVHDVDLVYHPATKFLGGHGMTIDGVFIDGGTFSYVAAGKHPELTEPYADFHDAILVKENTVVPFLLYARHEDLCDFSVCMNPMTAWQLLQGVETLPLRMAQRMDSARCIVAFLAGHPMVASVACPEPESRPDRALAERPLPRGCGVMFSFNLHGDRRAGQQFIESLGLFSRPASASDVCSLVIYPALTAYFRIDADALAVVGISEGAIHLSIGLEDADGLIDDPKRGLKAAGRTMPVAPDKADANATRTR